MDLVPSLMLGRSIRHRRRIARAKRVLRRGQWRRQGNWQVFRRFLQYIEYPVLIECPVPGRWPATLAMSGRYNTIDDVKAKIQYQLGIPHAQQILMYDGQELQDDRTLSDYRYISGDLLQLVFSFFALF